MAEDEGNDFRSLMIAANGGDADAYARLLYGLAPVIRRIVGVDRQFVGADAVEDVVQDVLLSIHTVRATYNPDQPFMPWVFAIARHRIIDAGRRRVRLGSREVEFDEADVTFSTADPNIHDRDVFDMDALRTAIERLPNAQRQAIELLKMGELSLREASAATGMSIGALKVAAHRGMAALRAKLRVR
ncbi:MAG: RNA polymerase subunit sigma [Acidobacteria bacterium]|nr:MAG: RNA polymerase subunit sigma [Acidobacteriota bacterium]